MLRTAIKRVLEAIDSNETALASSAFVSACSVLDKSVKAGLIHQNKAARHKSHLAQKLKAMGAPSLLQARESGSEKEATAAKAKTAKTKTASAKKETAKKASAPKVKKEAKAEKPAAAKKAPAKKAAPSKKAESKPKKTAK